MRFLQLLSIAVIGGFALLAILQCSGGGDGEYNPFYGSFVEIDPEPGSTIEFPNLEISGKATCPECPNYNDWATGGCPYQVCPETTRIDISWANNTTGMHGDAEEKLTNSCVTFFGWCRCKCVLRWSASIPLALGENEIVVTAFDPQRGTDDYTMIFTRLLSPPANVAAIAHHGSITVSWDSVADATSYDLYWSLDKDIDTDTAHKIFNVISPYTLWSLSDDVPYYFVVQAVRDTHESNPSDLVWAVPGWPIETVAETDASVISTSIALDALDNPHIHYSTYKRDYVNYIDLYTNSYVTKQAGSWITIPLGDMAEASADIALDNDDTIHISYIDSAGLDHAIYSFGSWLPELVDAYVSDNVSLAVDTQGYVHLAYRQGPAPPYSLIYKHNIPGYWKTTSLSALTDIDSVEAHVQEGKMVSMDVAADGIVHIAYVGEVSEQGLRYVTNEGGLWSSSSLDTDVQQQLSLEVDSNGKAHIIYSSYWGNLKYAHNTSGSWSTEPVGSETSSYYPSIAIDSAGHAHIIYFNTEHDEVRYATNATGSWRIIPLVTLATVSFDKATGVRTAIAVDAANNVYLSYNFPGKSLKFSTNK